MISDEKQLKVEIDKKDGLYIEQTTDSTATITNDKYINIHLSSEELGQIYNFCRRFFGDM